MLTLSTVKEDSLSFAFGFRSGDKLVAINGENVQDMLDVAYFDNFQSFSAEVLRGDKKVELKVDKGYAPMDWDFLLDCYIEPKWCANKCMFCFVDQLPKGQRKTLYVKDDDWRLSFVSGNFVTLTNVNEQDISRILRRKYSPLYVSVHATDDDLRRKLLGKPDAQPIMPLLKRLCDGGISIHAQVVMCPDVNDGKQLQKTIEDVYSLAPMAKSLAIVPVGLTKFREGLSPEVKPVGKEVARKTIEFVEQFDKKVFDKTGEHFVFCSDEMYLCAEQDVPSYDSYGDFDQIENGVGLIADFRCQFSLSFEDAVGVKDKGFTLVTGVAAAPLMKETLAKIKEVFPTFRGNVLTVENEFFGKTVTVAGLIVGADIISAVQKNANQVYDTLVLPRVMLKETEDVFLDGTTLAELKERLHKNVLVSADGYELCRLLLKCND